MKKITPVLLAAAMALPLAACSAQQQSGNNSEQPGTTVAQTETKSDRTENDRETIYQVALLQSLTQGYYDGIIKVSELRQHGDIGIGTFEGVNGEMIVLDGTVYQALGDGTVQKAADDETVPFSNVTFFDKDGSLELSDINDVNALKEKLNAMVEENGKNLFYFVKMSGTFEKMNVRSEIKQEKPYKTLDKALETDQREFNYDNITGTVVALYCPDYMNGLNTPGWHFHFISDDKKQGGHILELSLKEGTVELDKTDKFTMILHNDPQFHQMNLAKDMSKDIRSAEHDTQSDMNKED